ncbi:unnamed protein product [Sphagnum balticum]
MNKSNNNVIGTIAKIYVAIDLLWATIFATFGSILASQGLSLSGSGVVAATTGGIGMWIFTFFVAAFQGALFLLVFSFFGGLAIFAALELSKKDPGLRRFFGQYALVCLIADLLWAALMGTFASSILAQFGIHVGAAAGATSLGAVLLWIIGFVAAFCQGAVFLAVGTLFLACAFCIYVFLSHK